MQANVLIVEDEDNIRELLSFTLETAGFVPIQAASAEEGLAILREELPDLVLIDWMLPGMDGLTLARRLRQDKRTRELPLLMLTARGDESDRVEGLDAGADDYITKPFSPRELIARVKAVLRRRSPEHGDSVLTVGGIAVDNISHRVTVHGTEVTLGPTEFKLLTYLMARVDRVFSREQLLNAVWGDHRFVDERTVDVYIRRLRSTLGVAGDAIETVRGFGYKMNSSVSSTPAGTTKAEE